MLSEYLILVTTSDSDGKLNYKLCEINKGNIEDDTTKDSITYYDIDLTTWLNVDKLSKLRIPELTTATILPLTIDGNVVCMFQKGLVDNHNRLYHPKEDIAIKDSDYDSYS
jgi:hypothetical protein